MSNNDETQTASPQFSTLQIGLTGSIGMGKSSVSKQLMKLGFPVFDADKEVHTLYASGGLAVEPIRDLFPDAIAEDNSVNRSKLMEIIMNNSSCLQDIERIVHPLVIKGRQSFYKKCNAEGQFLVVYDIPLLFENRANYEVDYIIVVTADAETQRTRVLSRPGMTMEKFESILLNQVPDSIKREQGDFLIHTGFPSYREEVHTEARAQLARILETITEAHPGRWNQWKNRNMPQLEAVHAIKKAYDIVLFDLDDTLVPLMKPLKAALDFILAYTRLYMPLSANEISTELRPSMAIIAKENPLIAHDLSEIRYRALTKIASKYGEEDKVPEAMKRFIEVRSDISNSLYSDVIECFDWLTSIGVQVGIMTNGNADIVETEANAAVSSYLKLCLHAGDVGAMKPSPIAFLACAQLSGTVSKRILYVGDAYDKDVSGAKYAGMTGVLLSREYIQEDGMTIEYLCDGGVEGVVSGGVEGKVVLEIGDHKDMAAYPDAAFILTSLRPIEFETRLLNYLKRRGSTSL